MRFSSSVGVLAVAAALLVGACGSSTASPSGSGASLRISPSASGSTAVTPGSSATVTGGSSPSSAPTAATINVPSDQLAFPGKLLICSDMQYPPQEFLDDQGNPIGSDVEIGQDIGRRLGLQVQFVNSVFSTIVQALMDGRCDIIISAQPSTATTKKRVDMITYFQAGQSFVVAKGNPQKILERKEKVVLRPLLIMQGELDDNVLPSVQEKFAKAYRAAGGDVQYELFKGSVHEWVAEPGPQTDRAHEMVKAFIARQLAA